MRKFLVSIILYVICVTSSLAQNYKTHKVKVGESIETIAKMYMVTPYDIIALNPDAKVELQTNSILIIPKSKISSNPSQTEELTVSRYKVHKVKRRETLFRISQRYNVSIEEIKKHNKRLYSENLKKGDRIKIPQFKSIIVTNNLENTIKKYKVEPKEGKWRIAYKFGISVADLEELNPKMGDSLQLGEEINVPNIADNEIRSIDTDYGYYTVLPKEGFYRLKIKLGMSQEQLEALNPELLDGGLKVGMVLKVPKDVESAILLSDVEQTSLVSKITNFKTKQIAVMLPFRLHRVDLDSISEAKEILQNDSYMSISLDFHSGVLTALDSAKHLGISTNLDVFDTKARLSEVSRILSNNDFSNYDAVIGPFTADNFDRTSDVLKNDNIPVIAAVTTPKKLYSNVYQTIPSGEFLRRTMINYVKSDTLAKHIIIITDSKNKAIGNALKKELTVAKQILSRVDKDGNDANYILIDDIELEIREGRNIVFLETDNEGFVSNVTSMLSALNGYDTELEIEREIILMTTNKNKAFENSNVSNYDLSSLKFHYPSVNRPYNIEDQNGFVKNYQAKYGAEPNKYAVRGFDLTMDLLLRLSIEEYLFDASSSDIETEYVENKFRYSKKMFGGYYNETGYILKFEDLKIVEVKY